MKVEIKQIIIVFIVWRIVLFALTNIAPAFYSLQKDFLGKNSSTSQLPHSIWAHANFDGEHYINIAKNGYIHREQAFFPVFPLIIRYINSLFGIDHLIAGLIIANLSFLVALIFLYKLLAIDYSSRISLLVVLFLIFFPTSFYHGSVYTESLFLLFVVLTFFFARTNRWIASGLFGALASGTRFMGIFLLPALAFECWMQWKKTKKVNKIQIFSLLLIPLGLLGYMYFLNQNNGDPFLFIKSLPNYGPFRSEKIILLYQVFYRYIKMLTTVSINSPLYGGVVLESVVGVSFLVTTVYSFRYTRLSYAVFGMFAYLIPTLTGSFVSLPRYVLTSFSSFILMSMIVQKRNWLRNIIIGVFVGFQCFYWVRFVMGYWVS